MAECIFCKIIDKSIPAKVILESEHALAFRDVNPQAPVHVLIVPKKHISGVMQLTQDDSVIINAIHRLAQEVARIEKVTEKGFRLIVNEGPDALQSVDHLHYHLMAGRKLGWPPG